MLRIFFACALAGTAALAQTAPAAQPPFALAEQLAPDTVVVAIHGVCPDPKAGAACVTNITRAQFDGMIGVMSFNTHILSTPAKRSFAESYADALALDAAAEKEGIDKDPAFLELMKIVRARTLADAYRRHLQEKYGKPSPEEVADYYKQNSSKYEQLQLDRIFIPRMNAHTPKGEQPAYEKKVQQLIESMRERAGKGEDMTRLQVEGYKTLGLNPPMTADFGGKGRSSFQEPLQQELFSLNPGETSKIISEPAGFSFYKVRSHDTPAFDTMKEEITREIADRNIKAALQAATAGVKTELNEQFFVNRPTPNRTGTTPPRMPPSKK